MTSALLDKIQTATLADARAWAASEEQMLWCLDWLELSAHSNMVNIAVDALEDHLEELLAKEAQR